jgi:hypothetical protein
MKRDPQDRGKRKKKDAGDVGRKQPEPSSRDVAAQEPGTFARDAAADDPAAIARDTPSPHPPGRSHDAAEATPPPGSAPGDAPPEPATLPGVILCDLCGTPMLERHCRLVCLRCGYERDCTDP